MGGFKKENTFPACQIFLQIVKEKMKSRSKQDWINGPTWFDGYVRRICDCNVSGTKILGLGDYNYSPGQELLANFP
jgi:hypothetical protein